MTAMLLILAGIVDGIVDAIARAIVVDALDYEIPF